MTFKEIENGVMKTAIRYGEKYNVEINQDFALLKLFEEMGEFAQSILIHQKKSRPEKHLPEHVSKKEMAKELADIVGMAMVNAHLLGIDLEEAIEKKWVSREWLKDHQK